MITLQSGANTVYLTLSEMKTLSNPVYVLVFVNDNTKEKYMVTNTATTVQDDIQQFTITVQANPTWTSGQVALSKYGFYHYYAYEVSTVVGLNYNTIIAADIRTYVPTYFTTLLEQGKMHFKAPAQTVNDYRDSVETVKAYGS